VPDPGRHRTARPGGPGHAAVPAGLRPVPPRPHQRHQPVPPPVQEQLRAWGSDEACVITPSG